MSIMGNVVGLAAPQPDWNQTDPNRGDYIRNKPDMQALENALQETAGKAADALPQSGGSLSGNLDLGGNRVTGLADPQSPTDGVSLDYLLRWDEAQRIRRELTLPLENWVEASGTYTQTAYVAGILETDCPHFGPVYSGSLEEQLAQKEAFVRIDELETADGVLVFTCFEEKPETDLTVQLEINR